MSYHHFVSKEVAKLFADEMYAKGHYVRIVPCKIDGSLHKWKVVVSYSS